MTTAEIQRSIRSEISHVVEPVEHAGGETAEDIHDAAEHVADAVHETAAEVRHAAEETAADLRHNEIMAELRSVREKIEEHHADAQLHAGHQNAVLDAIEEEIEEAGEHVEEVPRAVDELPEDVADEVEEVTESDPPAPENSERKRRHYFTRKGRK